MGIFQGRGMSKQYGNGGGNWAPPGKFRVRINRCIGKKGYKGESAIVELEVVKAFLVKTRNPQNKDEWIAADDPEKLVPAGTKYSWVNKMDKGPAAGNVADFVRVGLCSMSIAAGQLTDDSGQPLNLDPKTFEDFTDEDVEAIFGEENGFAGLEMDLETFMIKTQAGGDFTKHVFAMVPELAEQLPKAA